MLIPGTVSGKILSSSMSKTPQMAQIAQAVDLGLLEWLRIPSSVVSGTGAGVVGAGGIGAGILSILPNPAFMEASFKGNGLLGQLAINLWTPVMLGVSGVYSLSGPSAIVGVGGFVGGFVGDVNLLIGSLFRSLGVMGIMGQNAINLALALGQGIYAHFLSGIVGGIIVGGVSLAISTGPITCIFQ